MPGVKLTEYEKNQISVKCDFLTINNSFKR